MENSSNRSSDERDASIAVLEEITSELESKISKFSLAGGRVSGSVATGFIIKPIGKKKTQEEPSGPIACTGGLYVNPLNATVVDQLLFVMFIVGNGIIIPTGTVTLQPFNVPFTLVNGVVSFTTYVPEGSYPNVYFNYSGDANYLPCISNSVPITITKAPVTVTIDIHPNPADTNTEVTFATIVVGRGGFVPTGTVTLLPFNSVHPLTDGGFSETLLVGEGTYNLQWLYPGDVNFLPGSSGVVTLVVNSATLLTPTITISTDPAPPIPPNQPFSVTFQVSGSGPTPTGTVAGYFDTIALPTETLDGSGKASWGINFEYAGTYLVQAFYSGDSNYNPGNYSIYIQVAGGTVVGSIQFGGGLFYGGVMACSYRPFGLTDAFFSFNASDDPPNFTGQFKILQDGATIEVQDFNTGQIVYNGPMRLYYNGVQDSGVGVVLNMNNGQTGTITFQFDLFDTFLNPSHTYGGIIGTSYPTLATFNLDGTPIEITGLAYPSLQIFPVFTTL